MKTERIQNERQQALEKMGISIQASGIKVEKNKYYLVNLNADPSLNELLVYYLKERTIVGARSCGSGVEPDIQLSGLGIQPEHCIITIEDGELFLEPVANARSYINGSQVTQRTQLRHGDRIVWGNHHFFRVNCPRSVCKFVSGQKCRSLTTRLIFKLQLPSPRRRHKISTTTLPVTNSCLTNSLTIQYKLRSRVWKNNTKKTNKVWSLFSRLALASKSICFCSRSGKTTNGI